MKEVSSVLQVYRDKLLGGEKVEFTPRELLSMFTAHRRGAKVTYQIRYTLNKLGLVTEPDFEQVYVDSKVQLKLAHSKKNPCIQSAKFNVYKLGAAGIEEDPVPRIGSLKAANRVPITISRDAEIIEAVTLMLLNDFSQLPVVTNERNVHGMISWRSIGAARILQGEVKCVRDCIEEIDTITSDRPLFEAIDQIARREVAVVKNGSGLICGIVTTADLSLEFRNRTEPFLLVGEIEKHIRRLIDGSFSLEELRKIATERGSKKIIETVADLTFGDYIRLLSTTDNWGLLKLNLAKNHVLKRLDQIREIRNEVMHFQPDPLEPEDIDLLRDTVKVLQQIQSGLDFEAA